MSTPLSSDPRYRSLDLWRGLACLMVVLDHAAIPALPVGALEDPLSNLEYGLRWLAIEVSRLGWGPPLFFVISGYCIAASIDSVRRKGKSAGDFLVRRLWRTFPPYWAAIALFVLVTAGLDSLGLRQWHRGPYGYELDSPGALDWSQWLGNLTLTETYRNRFFGLEPNVYTRVAWSLCYQEQFYAVCFLALLLAPRRLFRVLGIVTGLLLLVRVVAWDSGGLTRLHGVFPFFWHEFAVGLAVYVRLNGQLQATQRRLIDGGLVVLAIGALNTGFGSTVVAALFGLLLIAARPWDARLADLPGLSGVRACGKRCYSIYLVHMPIVAVGNMMLGEAGLTSFWARALVMVPIASITAVAAGWLFYQYVESRFLVTPDWRRTAARPSQASRPSQPTLAAA